MKMFRLESLKAIVTLQCLLQMSFYVSSAPEIRLNGFAENNYIESGPIFIIDSETIFITNIKYDPEKLKGHTVESLYFQGQTKARKRVILKTANVDGELLNAGLSNFEGEDLYLQFPNGITIHDVDRILVGNENGDFRIAEVNVSGIEAVQIKNADGFHLYNKDGVFQVRYPKCSNCSTGPSELSQCGEGIVPPDKMFNVFKGNRTYMDDEAIKRVIYKPYTMKPNCIEMYPLRPNDDTFYYLSDGILLYMRALWSKDNFCFDIYRFNGVNYETPYVCITEDEMEREIPESLNIIYVCGDEMIRSTKTLSNPQTWERSYSTNCGRIFVELTKLQTYINLFYDELGQVSLNIRALDNRITHRLTKNGTGIFGSAMGLIITCGIFTFIRSARECRGWNVIGYTLSTSAAFVCLACAILLHVDGETCKNMGFLYQFLLVSSFTWLCCLITDTYLRVRKFDSDLPEIRKAHYLVLSMIIPLFTVLVSFLINDLVPSNFLLPKSLLHEACWFRSGKKVFFYYIPIVVSICADIILLILTKWKMHENRNRGDQLWRYGNYCVKMKNIHRSNVCLIVIMSICWSGEIISYSLPLNESLRLVIDMITTLQGVFVLVIFIYHEPVYTLVRNRIRRHTLIVED